MAANPWAPIEAPPLSPRPPSRGWRPGPAIITLAITIAVLLIADAAALFVHVVDPSDDQLTAGGDGAKAVLVTPDQVPSPTATPLEQELPALLRFVQEARGLKYDRPVKVTLLDDKAFTRRIKAHRPDEDDGTRAKEAKNEERVLKAYGIIDPGVDLAKVLSSFYGSSIAGYYDHEHDDLVVRGEKLTPYVRMVLVHELTHALQDQHFDLDRKKLDDKDDESSSGFTGLVEGDAVRVETIYFDSLPQEQQKEAEREEAAAAGHRDPTIPQTILEIIYFPYLAGPPFTREVVAKAGQARLDEAFAHPPTTSEQLLHPDVFLAGQGTAPVEAPKPAGSAKELDKGVLGELGLTLVFQAAGLQDAGPAAQGWGGDRYVAWAKGDRTCVRTTLAMDSAKDLAELRSALRRFAQARKGTTVTGPPAGPVTFTTCD